MSVGLTMEDVNKPVTTQMDHLSAHVIRVIAYHLMAQTVLVSIHTTVQCLTSLEGINSVECANKIVISLTSGVV